jgi:DNA-binding NtrC family response regulator
VRILSRCLIREGRTVGVSPSSIHAIRVLEARAHLVVVTDLSMPGPDGSSLLNVIERRWPLTRRILLTAFADAHLVANTPQAHRVVDKSVTLSRIIEIIEEELSLAPAR